MCPNDHEAFGLVPYNLPLSHGLTRAPPGCGECVADLSKPRTTRLPPNHSIESAQQNRVCLQTEATKMGAHAHFQTSPREKEAQVECKAILRKRIFVTHDSRCLRAERTAVFTGYQYNLAQKKEAYSHSRLYGRSSLKSFSSLGRRSSSASGPSLHTRVKIFRVGNALHHTAKFLKRRGGLTPL